MKNIPLSQGLVAVVDDGDYPALVASKWYAHRSGGQTFYARRNVPGKASRQTIEFMHRLLLGAPAGAHVDHVNGDGLDNRRSNLRLATSSQNQCNRGRQSNNTSGFMGVTFHRRVGKWQGQIIHAKTKRHLGYFDTAEECARAYDAAALSLHGEFARLNFPEAAG